ncbi:hypothetical protein ADK38_10675 [Streptomyces varsoviensis]|uniref:Uncharacterized protein n=1 Tax=Streptomyces varsoviensis TaxID=67373 RepID=A0ABR5J9H9_9ACTN|nr:hypothetical protein ADK38_10675 [Streptomyces varsoviensis]
MSPFASAPAARASTASTSTQGHPTADTADSRSTPSAASQTAGEAGEAGESDEAEAWDASLLPLLGGKGSRSDGASDADAGLLREEQVGAAGVVGASAYMTARGAGADQAFAEPTRPAWRPKPAAEGALPRPEFACSGAEPEKRSAADPADTDAEKDDTARGRGKGRSKKRDEEGGSSVADLLRQSEDIWG